MYDGEKEKEDACDRWFESVKGVTRIKSLPYHQGTAANGHRVVYMPYMDLIELDFYRKQRRFVPLRYSCGNPRGSISRDGPITFICTEFERHQAEVSQV